MEKVPDPEIENIFENVPSLEEILIDSSILEEAMKSVPCWY